MCHSGISKDILQRKISNKNLYWAHMDKTVRKHQFLAVSEERVVCIHTKVRC